MDDGGRCVPSQGKKRGLRQLLQRLMDKVIITFSAAAAARKMEREGCRLCSNSYQSTRAPGLLAYCP
jgi:hypothetical protein